MAVGAAHALASRALARAAAGEAATAAATVVARVAVASAGGKAAAWRVEVLVARTCLQHLTQAYLARIQLKND